MNGILVSGMGLSRIGGVSVAIMEENWSFPNLVDSLQAIRNDLEVLRGEHENIVTGSDRDEGAIDICTVITS